MQRLNLGLLAAAMLAAAGRSSADDKEVSVVVAAEGGLGDNAQSVAFSPDGRYVAAAFGGPSNASFPLQPRGGGVAVWDAATGRQTHFFGEYGDILRLEFSADGRCLVYSRVYTPGDSVQDDTVAVCDLKTGKVVNRWRETHFAVSRTANEVFVGGRSGGTRYDLRTFAKRGDVPDLMSRCLATSADGKSLAAVHLDRVPLDKKLPDGQPVVALRPQGLSVYDAASLERRRNAVAEDLADCFAVAASPDGKMLVTGHADGAARVRAGERLAEVKAVRTGFDGHVFPFYSPDGRTLGLATQPVKGTQWKRDANAPGGFAVITDAPLAACSVLFLDTATWAETARWQFDNGSFGTHYARFGKSKHHPERNPARFAFSPDGKQVLAGCNGVVLMDVATGKVVRRFTRDAGPVGQPAS